MSMRFFINNPRYDAIQWDTPKVDSFEVCKTSSGTTRGNGYTILRDKIKEWIADLSCWAASAELDHNVPGDTLDPKELNGIWITVNEMKEAIKQ